MNCEVPPSSEIVRVTSKGEIVAAHVAGSAFVLVSDSSAGYASLGYAPTRFFLPLVNYALSLI